MATHIQPAGLADKGIAGETATAAGPAPPQARLRDRDRAARRSSPIVMLFPVLWMLETALKDTRDIYAVPAKVISFDADARPLQERLQLRLAGLLRASRTR